MCIRDRWEMPSPAAVQHYRCLPRTCKTARAVTYMHRPQPYLDAFDCLDERAAHTLAVNDLGWSTRHRSGRWTYRVNGTSGDVPKTEVELCLSLIHISEPTRPY